ncbi:condensation domain-containing protein [Streptomyces sp. M19]
MARGRPVGRGARPARERLAELLGADRAERFDLSAPPLIRCMLVRLGPDTYRFVLTSHHILLDGWSVPLLLNELFAMYARGGSDDTLPAVTPYRDYLVWLRGRDREAALDAWRRHLADLTEPTLLGPRARAGRRWCRTSSRSTWARRPRPRSATSPAATG